MVEADFPIKINNQKPSIRFDFNRHLSVQLQRHCEQAVTIFELRRLAAVAAAVAYHIAAPGVECSLGDRPGRRRKTGRGDK